MVVVAGTKVGINVAVLLCELAGVSPDPDKVVTRPDPGKLVTKPDAGKLVVIKPDPVLS